MIGVIYQDRETLYPAFGRADVPTQTVYVRDDLPDPVKRFVQAHEEYHLRDRAKWWIWREVKANLYGAWKHPWGFVICAVMSLSPVRLWFYWGRILEGK